MADAIASPSFRRTRLADHTALNEALLTAFLRLRGEEALRGTHHFHGRFENLYVDRALPEVEPVLAEGLKLARQLLAGSDSIDHDPRDLRIGYWFNAMEPGDRTSRHAHLEDGELVSGVYYIATPACCGDLVLHLETGDLRLTPEAGDLVSFKPEVDHSVEPHEGQGLRLSLAFNVGF